MCKYVNTVDIVRTVNNSKERNNTIDRGGRIILINYKNRKED